MTRWRPLRAGLALTLAAFLSTPALVLLVPSAQADTLARIQSRGAVLVCAFDDRLPYSRSAGDPPGFQIELARAIAERLGVALETRFIGYRFHARRAGCDMQMGTVARSGRDDDDDDDDRVSASALRQAAGQRIFNAKHRIPPRSSIPYFRSEVYLAGGERVRGLAQTSELQGLRIGALHGSWAHFLLDRAGVEPVTRYENEPAMMAAIDAGELDGALVTNTYLGWYRKNHPDTRVERIAGFRTDPSLSFNVGVSLRGADDALVERVNRILRTLLANGTVDRIYARYGIGYVPPALAGADRG